MGDLIICGLSMEMETAEELGRVGDCRMCLYADYYEFDKNKVRCSKKGIVEQQSDCKEWSVDFR